MPVKFAGARKLATTVDHVRGSPPGDRVDRSLAYVSAESDAEERHADRQLGRPRDRVGPVKSGTEGRAETPVVGAQVIDRAGGPVIDGLGGGDSGEQGV